MWGLVACSECPSPSSRPSSRSLPIAHPQRSPTLQLPTLACPPLPRQLIEHKEKHPKLYKDKSCADVYKELRAAVDLCHRRAHALPSPPARPPAWTDCPCR